MSQDVSQRMVGAPGGHHRHVRHPGFPCLPSTTPLTYTLTMKACLSEAAAERPTFADLVSLLEDCAAEVQGGSYADSEGNICVRCCCLHVL